MKIENIDVDSAINFVKELLQKERGLSPALKSALEVLLLLVALLLNRLTLNSKNSSKPPSTDPNRKKSSRGKGDKKPGGQKGRTGTTLEQVDDPDEVTKLKVDRRTLPKGALYREVGHECRQVIDIDISRVVTEYRAQILEDEQGICFVAPFPEGGEASGSVWPQPEGQCGLYVPVPADSL